MRKKLDKYLLLRLDDEEEEREEEEKKEDVEEVVGGITLGCRGALTENPNPKRSD